MNWFDWIFASLLALHFGFKVLGWFMREPSPDIDPLSEPHGDVVNAPRRSV